MKLLFITFIIFNISYLSAVEKKIDPSINIGCYSEEGSAFEMTVVNNYDVDSLKVRVRSGKFRSIQTPNLTAFDWSRDSNGIIIKSLVLTEGQKIIVAVANGTYVDEIAESHVIISCRSL